MAMIGYVMHRILFVDVRGDGALHMTGCYAWCVATTRIFPYRYSVTHVSIQPSKAERIAGMRVLLFGPGSVGGCKLLSSSLQTKFP